ATKIPPAADRRRTARRAPLFARFTRRPSGQPVRGADLLRLRSEQADRIHLPPDVRLAGQPDLSTLPPLADERERLPEPPHRDRNPLEALRRRQVIRAVSAS